MRMGMKPTLKISLKTSPCTWRLNFLGTALIYFLLLLLLCVLLCDCTLLNHWTRITFTVQYWTIIKNPQTRWVSDAIVGGVLDRTTPYNIARLNSFDAEWHSCARHMLNQRSGASALNDGALEVSSLKMWSWPYRYTHRRRERRCPIDIGRRERNGCLGQEGGKVNTYREPCMEPRWSAWVIMKRNEFLLQWTTVSSLIHAAKCTSFTKIQSMDHAFTGWFMLLQAEPRLATLISRRPRWNGLESG